MHRNFKLCLSLLFGVLTVAVVVTVVSLPTIPDPVSLGIQNYTNAQAVVTVTNLTRRPIDYVVKIEHQYANGWPKYPGGIPMGTDIGPPRALRPGESTNLLLSVMTYAPACPWRVSIFCYWNPPGPKSLRFKVGRWLFRLHIPSLARKVSGQFK